MRLSMLKKRLCLLLIQQSEKDLSLDELSELMINTVEEVKCDDEKNI